jgi:cell wall-associated NlpC family hydrolase
MTTVARWLLPLIIVALSIASGACAARGGVPRPFPGASIPPGAGEDAIADGAAPSAGEAGPTENQTPDTDPADARMLPAVIDTALGLLGIPYRNGGSDPSGFDCSGFVQYIFSRVGTYLPREARDQFLVGRRVDLDEVEPGDLLFFETVARGASHVGLVIGGGRFVHAPSSRGVVRVEPYTASYWARRFVGARRVTEANAAASIRFPGAVRFTR